MGRHRFFDDSSWTAPMHEAVKLRVIYGDTDQMRVVYHANYLRFMERARVEFMRQQGVVYAQLEGQGVGLPVVDLALSYRAPALYDDDITIYVGLQRVSWARIHFSYRLAVMPGGRAGLDSELDLLFAETRHGAIDMKDGGATRLPEDVYETLAALKTEP